jgi:hypothetical protein
LLRADEMRPQHHAQPDDRQSPAHVEPPNQTDYASSGCIGITG